MFDAPQAQLVFVIQHVELYKNQLKGEYSNSDLSNDNYSWIQLISLFDDLSISYTSQQLKIDVVISTEWISDW